MEQLLAHKYLQALETISRLAPLLADRLEPGRGNVQESFKAPTRPTSKPPCNLTWLDLKREVERLLRIACRQVRQDTGNLYGTPMPTIQGMTGWLTNQHEHLATCMWLDSQTWWQIQTGEEGTNLAAETINHAHLLMESLDPPVKQPPAGTATQMCLATGIPTDTIRNWRRAGKLPAIKINGHWVYKLADIQNVGAGQ